MSEKGGCKKEEAQVDLGFRCPNCPRKYRSFAELRQHLFTGETTLFFFACHCCKRAFSRRSELVSTFHCDEWRRRRVEHGEEAASTMRVCYHMTVCAGCGLQVSLSSDAAGAAFLRLVKDHSSRKLVNLAVFAAEKITFAQGETAAVKVTYMPMLERIPLKCHLCDEYDFSSADDIEFHLSLAHQNQPTLKCPACDCTYGSRLFCREHVSSEHLSDKGNVVELLHLLSKTPKAVNGVRIDEEAGHVFGERKRAADVGGSRDDEELGEGRLLIDELDEYGENLKAVTLSKDDYGGQFAASLVENFQRTATLYLTSFDGDDFRTATQLSLLRDYLACRLCLQVVADRTAAEDHLRLAHNAEIIDLRLTKTIYRRQHIGAAGSNDVDCESLICPKCSAASCSSFDLRRHMMTTHDQWLPKGLVEKRLTPVADDDVVHDKKSGTTGTVSWRRETATQVSQEEEEEDDKKKSPTKSKLNRKRKQVDQSQTSADIVRVYPNTSTTPVSTSNTANNSASTSVPSSTAVSSAATTAFNASPATYLLSTSPNMRQLFIQPIAAKTVVASSSTTPAAAGSSTVRQIAVPTTNGKGGKRPLKALPPKTVPFLCSVCELFFDEIVELKKHLMKQHLNACAFCGSCFVTDEQCRSHSVLCTFKTCKKEVGFVCELCASTGENAATFPTTQQYYVHLINLHGEAVKYEADGQITPAPIQKSTRRKQLLPKGSSSVPLTVIGIFSTTAGPVLAATATKPTEPSSDAAVAPSTFDHADYVASWKPIAPAPQQQHDVTKWRKCPVSLCGQILVDVDEYTFCQHVLSHPRTKSACPVNGCGATLYSLRQYRIHLEVVHEREPNGCVRSTSQSENKEDEEGGSTEMVSLEESGSASPPPKLTFEGAGGFQGSAGRTDGRDALAESEKKTDEQSDESGSLMHFNFGVEEEREAEVTIVESTTASSCDAAEMISFASVTEQREQDEETDKRENDKVYGSDGTVGAANANQSAADDDDDVMILDVGEESSETSEKGIGTRRTCYSCTLCTKSFQTRSALTAHLAEHTYDAGSTCSVAYPVPIGKPVYVCRLCCLAYESQSTYERHNYKHGKVESCTNCSAVCFTRQQLLTHGEAHRTNKINYGCSICLKAFDSELRLRFHLLMKHSQPPLWICKICGFGIIGWRGILAHMSASHAVGVSARSSIGVCSASQLHYQPIDTAAYEEQLSKETQSVSVADCPHRSFLTYNETMLSCDKCFSIVAASKLILENSRLSRMNQVQLVMEADENVRFNWEEYERLLLGLNQNPASSAQSQTTQTQTTVSVKEASTVPPISQSLNNVNYPTIRPRNLCLPGRFACLLCREQLQSEPSLKVHRLKHFRQDMHFCLVCGESYRYKNIFQRHVVAQHEQKLKFYLQCPLCPFCTTDCRVFDNHMKASTEFGVQVFNHARLPFKASCGLWFGTPTSRQRHDIDHRQNGRECCPLCGACFGASESAEGGVSRALLEHMVSHALNSWHMCRECGLCFRSAVDCIGHFADQHSAKPRPFDGTADKADGDNNDADSQFVCVVCRRRFALASHERHVLEYHQLYGHRLKPTITVDREEMSRFLQFDTQPFKKVVAVASRKSSGNGKLKLKVITSS